MGDQERAAQVNVAQSGAPAADAQRIAASVQPTGVPEDLVHVNKGDNASDSRLAPFVGVEKGENEQVTVHVKRLAGNPGGTLTLAM